MATEINIHPIQIQILRILLFSPEARFRDLNIDKLPTDQFTFHIKQLTNLEIIIKNKSGRYKLTQRGKEFANRFDTDKNEIERQAKIGALVIALKKDGKINKILVQKRLKQPFYGYIGFVSGKIRWGEKVLETASRELLEETGLSAEKLKFLGIEHKTDYSLDGKILEDKFFYVVKATNLSGKFIEKFEGGENAWLSEKEILKEKNIFQDVPKLIRKTKSNKFFFIEDSFQYEDSKY